VFNLLWDGGGDVRDIPVEDAAQSGGLVALRVHRDAQDSHRFDDVDLDGPRWVASRRTAGARGEVNTLDCSPSRTTLNAASATWRLG